MQNQTGNRNPQNTMCNVISQSHEHNFYPLHFALLIVFACITSQAQKCSAGIRLDHSCYKCAHFCSFCLSITLLSTSFLKLSTTPTPRALLKYVTSDPFHMTLNLSTSLLKKNIKAVNREVEVIKRKLMQIFFCMKLK